MGSGSIETPYISLKDLKTFSQNPSNLGHGQNIWAVAAGERRHLLHAGLIAGYILANFELVKCSL